MVERDKKGALQRRIAQASAEDSYDDARDHQRCPDCKGSGYYIGFTERRLCPTCDGSGWL